MLYNPADNINNDKIIWKRGIGVQIVNDLFLDQSIPYEKLIADLSANTTLISDGSKYVPAKIKDINVHDVADINPTKLLKPDDLKQVLKGDGYWSEITQLYSDLTTNSNIYIDHSKELDSTYVEPNTINPILNFANQNTRILNIGEKLTNLNIAHGDNIQTINIATSSLNTSTTTINIGKSGDIVNIGGTLNYVDTNNLQIEDNVIRLNHSTNIPTNLMTSSYSGIEIEDNVNNVRIPNAGFIHSSNDSTFYQLKAPQNEFILSTPNLIMNSLTLINNGVDQNINTNFLFKNGLGIDSQIENNESVLKIGEKNSKNIFIGQSSYISEINIGVSDSRNTAAVINIGKLGDMINIGGTLNHINQENLIISDKTITLNSSLSTILNSARESGLYIRDNGNDRSAFILT
jgi:hypothetical protein